LRWVKLSSMPSSENSRPIAPDDAVDRRMTRSPLDQSGGRYGGGLTILEFFAEPCGAHMRLMRQCLDFRPRSWRTLRMFQPTSCFDLHAEQTTNLPKHGDGRSSGYSVTRCGVFMRYAAIVGVVIGVLAVPAQAQPMPPAFEDMAQIVCVDQDMAIELLDVYEQDTDRGEELLADREVRGVCERATFSGKPVADLYPSKTRHTGGIREGHVFEVEVTSGEVLKGLTKVYMVMYVIHDNEV
jgi:hypothetical protein